MAKRWLSYDDQVTLLSERGMRIEDATAAAYFLSRVNYYRFSGYFRHWQRDPGRGDNSFIDGTSFDVVRSLYEAEEQLVAVCDDLLHPLEVLLRTRFAHSYSCLVRTTGGFCRGEGFTQSPDPLEERVEEYALRDLDRSKEVFVAHYRDELKQQGRFYGPEAYDGMPIWVAVEAFSFGNLSRLIAASGESRVLDEVAESMNTSRKLLPGQVRSFVYLRNRIAHCARLWNHSVLDVPGVQPNTARRIRRGCRSFAEHSVYKVLVALDDVASRSKVRSDWLNTKVEPILQEHPILAHGIAHPTRYGDMPQEVLALNTKSGSA